MNKGQIGFSLIELMVVIGSIAILAVIVLTAINPATQWAQARNRQRINDIYQVVNAVHQYAVANKSVYPVSIQSMPQDIGSKQAKLADILVPEYLPKLPYDPRKGDAAETFYVVFRESNRITASATAAELGKEITVSR